MGNVFEELIRRFNAENNEEAGEDFPPRDVVERMADLTFKPIVHRIQDATPLVDFIARCTLESQKDMLRLLRGKGFATADT